MKNKFNTNNVPNSICWNITCRCNEKCKFCFRETGLAELSHAEQLKVIDAIAASGIVKLTFAGGEPLLVSGIEDLILYAKSKGLMVSMTTNSTLINKERCDFLLENLDWLTLSLDGANDEIQSLMTRNGKHATKVKQILEYASSYENKRCRIKINTVVSNKNYKYIADIADIVRKYNVERWKLMQFTPLRSYAVASQAEFEISRENFTDAFQVAQNCLGNRQSIVGAHYCDDIEQAHFIALANGDVRIAHNHQEQILGNLLHDDISDIWMQGAYNRDRHNERTGFLHAQELSMEL